MAGSRSLRAERGPRVHPSVLAAAPLRLRAGAGGPRTVPPVGLAHARSPRARGHAGYRGHDRSAGAGFRERGRHGDGRAVLGRALQPPGQRDREPPHIRDLLRRGHDGGGQPGGVVDRGPLPPRQADRLLRRKPHHDRRHDLDLLRQRGSRRAHAGVRLARAARRGLGGRGRDRARRGGGTPGRGASLLHRDPLAHRIPGATCDGHGQGARRPAGRGGGARCEGGDGL